MKKKILISLLVLILIIISVGLYFIIAYDSFYGYVLEKEGNVLVVNANKNTYRVKCSNADEICIFDTVKVIYKGKIVNGEITAVKVRVSSGFLEPVYDKPVIYLYPTEETEVNVKLTLNGELTCTYPNYNDGWSVTAQPDGTLTNKADGKEYSYLYWEGISDVEYDMSKGFVVKGEDTAEFLQEKLAYIGLTPKEYNEFIVYWLPKMQDNTYNLITFQGNAYTNNAVLDITPKPDSILRVFMVYKPLDEAIEIEEQPLDTFTRQGFTVVEWGGTCVE